MRLAVFSVSASSFSVNTPSSRNTVIVIAGPTAVGKTSLAIKLAQYFNTQIISADSRQCYKELGIAVAKPSNEELAQVLHYFINSHSIYEDVNAGTYEAYALNAVTDIFQQSNIAVMVGGTGLYIKAFCEGIDEMPAIDATIRNEIIANYEANGLAWLQQEVQQRDNAFWHSNNEKENPQRLMRALEMVVATGKSISSFRQKKKAERPFNIIKIGLKLPREQLQQNINTRVDQMIEHGLLEEAKALLPFRSINAMQTVGYREFFDHFDGDCTLEQAIERLKINTRQYAKRQMTWFKKDEEITWFAPTDIDTIINLVKQ